MPTTSSASYATHSKLLTAFDRFASRVTRWAGSPLAFTISFLTVVVWAVSGPIFHFSENWQLVINTGTTIVTFLMVFLIQQSQNKDSVAIHLKLNELLAANRNASNRMIGIEDLDEQDLRDVATFYVKLAERAENLRAEQGGPLDRRRGDADPIGLLEDEPAFPHTMYGEAAFYLDKIFHGESPADMPFAQPKKFELVINTKTAAALGLVLPRSLLLKADELIS